MKLIDRFMGRQLLLSFGAALAVLSLVLVIGNLFRRLLPLLVNQDLPAEYLFAFVAYVLPFSFIFTIPWSLLTSVLLVFGRLSADNELIAFRSNGVSLYRICAPLAVLALACTGISLWLNLRVAPATQMALRTMILDLAVDNPMALFGSDQVIDQFPGRRIYVGGKKGNQLENIIVFEINQQAVPIRVTYARSGTLEADLPNRRILMHLTGARYQQRDEKFPYDLRRIRDGINMEEGTLPISLEELYQRERERPRRSAMSVEQLLEQLKTGSPGEQSASRTELNKRLSFPFACLAFALIAVPLGITTHRRETSAGFLISIVVAFAYFLFIILADALRSNPAVRPELLVWLPNVLFLGLGGWLFWRQAQR